MRLNEVKQLIPVAAKARVPLLLWGKHGIGKTSVVEQAAKSLGWRFFALRVGPLEGGGDILGPLAPTEDGVAKFLESNWMQEAKAFCSENPDKRYIIFLDEINRPERASIQQALFQFIESGKIMEHQMPENCYIMAAANYNTRDYSTTYIKDAAWDSRMCHIDFVPHTDEFIGHMKEREDLTTSKEASTYLSFLTEHKSFIYSHAIQDYDIFQHCSPDGRSHERFMRLLNAGLTDLPDSVQREVLKGLVGTEAALAYESYKENLQEAMVAGSDVFTAYPKVREKVLSFVENDNIASLRATCDEMLPYLTSVAGDVSKEQTENVISFLEDIPPELSFQSAHSMFRHLDLSNEDENKHTPGPNWLKKWEAEYPELNTRMTELLERITNIKIEDIKKAVEAKGA